MPAPVKRWLTDYGLGGGGGGGRVPPLPAEPVTGPPPTPGMAPIIVLGGATAGSNGSNSGLFMSSHSGLPGLGHDVPWQAQARFIGNTTIMVC